MSEMLEVVDEYKAPTSYARHLATYIRCPSTIRARTFDQFGRGPSLERCRKYRAEVEEREQRKRMDNRSWGSSPYFNCGHPRKGDNIIERDGIDRCRTCRIESEREAAKRHRAKVIQRAIDRLTINPVEQPANYLTPGDLINLAAMLFNTTRADILGDSKFIEHVIARAAVAAVLKSERGMSLPAIGRVLGGRDHSTVSNAINKLPGYINRRPDIEQAIVTLAEAARKAA